jgi:cell division protein FtsN
MVPTDYKQRTARSSVASSKRQRATKAQRPQRNNASGAVSRWRWFGAGLCVGAVATAALFLYEPSITEKGADRIAASASAENARARTKFEFYAVLPEREMVIPETEVEIATPAPVSLGKSSTLASTQVNNNEQSQYMLQVGSFRSFADADRVKAKLALLGLVGSIQTIMDNDQETWHRVQVGPYSKRAKLDEVKAALKNNGFEVLPLKLKRHE